MIIDLVEALIMTTNIPMEKLAIAIAIACSLNIGSNKFLIRIFP